MGIDEAHGGNGNDRINVGGGNDLAYGDAGNDFISGEAGNDVLYGGIGNDQFYGGDGNDQIHGDAGADTLIGDAGADTLWGGADADRFVFKGAGATMGMDTVMDFQDGLDLMIFGKAWNNELLELRCQRDSLCLRSTRRERAHQWSRFRWPDRLGAGDGFHANARRFGFLKSRFPFRVTVLQDP